MEMVRGIGKLIEQQSIQQHALFAEVCGSQVRQEIRNVWRRRVKRLRKRPPRWLLELRNVFQFGSVLAALWLETAREGSPEKCVKPARRKGIRQS